MKNIKQSKAFTLVEVSIVIMLIAILSGVILRVINPSGIQQKGRDAQRAADLKRIQTALELYFAQNKNYPKFTTLTAVGAPTVGGVVPPFTNALDEYINLLPADPKNGVTQPADCTTAHGYMYKSNAAGTRYVLIANTESVSSAKDNLCSNLSQTAKDLLGTSFTGASCTKCYGVENP